MKKIKVSLFALDEITDSDADTPEVDTEETKPKKQKPVYSDSESENALVEFVIDLCNEKGPFTTTAEKLLVKFQNSKKFKKKWAKDKEDKLKLMSDLRSTVADVDFDEDGDPSMWDKAGVTIIQLDEETLAFYNEKLFELFKEL